MSAKTDAYEIEVAQWINLTPGIEAGRPKTSVSFSDIILKRPGGNVVWLEVKSEHGDNLVNPRVYYDKMWQTTYTSYSAQVTVDILNSLDETKQFIQAISTFANVPFDKVKIPTNKSQFKNDPGVIPIDVFKSYFDQPGVNRYIANVVSYDIGSLVTKDYNDRHVFYMQAGDDFYKLGNSNPLGLPVDVPEIQGLGDFKVRISTRALFTEVQAELKVFDLPYSKYSCKPNTHKVNPFNPEPPWYS